MSDLSKEAAYPLNVTARKKTRWGGTREGAGRPSEVEDPIRFTFDLERTEMEALRALSEARGVSVAKIVRRAVRAYVRRRGTR